MSIEVRSITKTFGRFRALDDISLRVDTGELVALLGPSGCGKTTLLRIIAGLQVADQGEVLFHDEDISERSVRERRVGFVFQHYALFRHMSVFDNVAFGLNVMPRRKRPRKAEIRERVMDLLKLVQVDWLANQYPSQLSGGQRQRVALARALIIEPKVLLLDEPFGALDARVRRELRRWLRRLHDEIHVTSVFVTHDQEEALEVSDRVVIMNEGRIVQEGTPEQVYDEPATPFVYEFLGNVNRFRSEPIGAESGYSYVRPQDFEIHLTSQNGSAIAGSVRQVLRVGPVTRIEVVHEEGEFDVELPHDRAHGLALEKGTKVYLVPKRVRHFPDSLTSSRL
ncbi:MAG: TOBE-like domain-containing protein [Candidatus Sumerlaeia bacterium]|nr:TOBE-like domain-containing protein [Candidatus Sumerlaeia bacterium]